jgi:hypothetical protein
MNRWLLGSAVAALLVAPSGRVHATATSQSKPVTFKGDIAPLLNEKCQPCHFKGGKVFDKLPFDQYKTVVSVASRLNTRLKGKDAELVAKWIEGGSVE